MKLDIFLADGTGVPQPYGWESVLNYGPPFRVQHGRQWGLGEGLWPGHDRRRSPDGAVKNRRLWRGWWLKSPTMKWCWYYDVILIIMRIKNLICFYSSWTRTGRTGTEVSAAPTLSRHQSLSSADELRLTCFNSLSALSPCHDCGEGDCSGGFGP